MTQIEIAWNPTLDNWIKVNSNGSIKKDINSLRHDGAIKDTNRKWLFGYARPLSSSSTFVTKYWGCYM